MNKLAVRQGDRISCPQHGGNLIIEGSPNVYFNHKPAARVGHSFICLTGDRGKLMKGSSNITINGYHAVRQSDGHEHGGEIIECSANVRIGETGNPVKIGSNGKPVYIGNNGKPVKIGLTTIQTNTE